MPTSAAPVLDAAEQFRLWLRAAQCAEYSTGATAWLKDFHRRLDDVDEICWPDELRARDLSASSAATLLFLKRARQSEALVLGVRDKDVVLPGALSEDVMVGSLAEDVVQGFVRGQDPSVEDGDVHVWAEYNGDVRLVAAVARVASVLVMARRCQHDGEEEPSGFDALLDSQGLGAVVAAPADLLTTPDVGYGEALVACHRAHVQRAGREGQPAEGLHEFEQNLWRRVLLVVRNQMAYVRPLRIVHGAAHVLVEGDLDFESHDTTLEEVYWSLPPDERDPDARAPRLALQQYIDDHEARLRSEKGPARAAKRRFDFMFATAGLVSHVHLIEFKSTKLGRRPKPPDMRAYAGFLERFASRGYGTAETHHVSSLVTPSDVACQCSRVHHG